MLASSPLTIEFVCTANIARSPYAALYSASRCDPAQVTVRSSGVAARAGHPMDDQMAVELRFRGVDGAAHRSALLDGPRVATADLILTMEARQRRHIIEHWPEAIPKTFTIAQFVTGLRMLPAPVPTSPKDLISAVFSLRVGPVGDDDIDDPYGQSPLVAERVAVRLDGLVWGVLDGLGIHAARMNADPSR